jgi:hypothetical protein
MPHFIIQLMHIIKSYVTDNLAFIHNITKANKCNVVYVCTQQHNCNLLKLIFANFSNKHSRSVVIFRQKKRIKNENFILFYFFFCFSIYISFSMFTAMRV